MKKLVCFFFVITLLGFSGCTPKTSGKNAAIKVKNVAVVETQIDEQSGAAVELNKAEVREITATLRREAVRNLSRDRYNVMTTETVQAMGDAVLEECAEENCVIALGSKIGADYIARGIISKFQTMFSLTVELYETEYGNLIASADAVRSENLIELLEKSSAACADMYKKFAETSPGAPKPAKTATQRPTPMPKPNPMPMPMPTAETTTEPPKKEVQVKNVAEEEPMPASAFEPTPISASTPVPTSPKRNGSTINSNLQKFVPTPAPPKEEQAKREVLEEDLDDMTALFATPSAPVQISAVGENPPHWYLNHIRQKIDIKWKPGMIGDRNLSVEISFVINRDGTVENVSITKTSGNTTLDQRAIASVEEAAPFLKLPDHFAGILYLNLTLQQFRR
jgi:TonB family protein